LKLKLIVFKTRHVGNPQGAEGVSGCGSEQGISAATSLATMQQCNNGQTNNARCEKCGTLRMFNKQTIPGTQQVAAPEEICIKK